MKTYNDLVNVEEFWWKKEDFKEERWEISYYCKDCEKIVEAEKQNSDSYIFVCKICSGKNIAIWTLEWLKTNYKLK